jgi:hypothetical protein
MEHTAPYAASVLKLLRGSISEDTDAKDWEQLLTYEKQIREYLDKIGITLHLDKTDCYAFLKQSDPGEDSDLPALPRLTRRTMIRKNETLLLILLREALLEIEEQNAAVSPVLRRESIYEMMNPYLPETTDEVERRKDIDRIIAKIMDLGFLKDLKNDHFKIERIIKARVNLEELEIIKNKFSKGAPDDGTVFSDDD